MINGTIALLGPSVSNFMVSQIASSGLGVPSSAPRLTHMTSFAFKGSARRACDWYGKSYFNDLFHVKRCFGIRFRSAAYDVDPHPP